MGARRCGGQQAKRPAPARCPPWTGESRPRHTALCAAGTLAGGPAPRSTSDSTPPGSQTLASSTRPCGYFAKACDVDAATGHTTAVSQASRLPPCPAVCRPMSNACYASAPLRPAVQNGHRCICSYVECRQVLLLPKRDKGAFLFLTAIEEDWAAGLPPLVVDEDALLECGRLGWCEAEVIQGLLVPLKRAVRRPGCGHAHPFHRRIVLARSLGRRPRRHELSRGELAVLPTPRVAARKRANPAQYCREQRHGRNRHV